MPIVSEGSQVGQLDAIPHEARRQYSGQITRYSGACPRTSSRRWPCGAPKPRALPNGVMFTDGIAADSHRSKSPCDSLPLIGYKGCSRQLPRSAIRRSWSPDMWTTRRNLDT